MSRDRLIISNLTKHLTGLLITNFEIVFGGADSKGVINYLAIN